MNRVIVLDPGHGGDDPGAVWPPGSSVAGSLFVEKDLNQNLCWSVAHAIDSFDWPLECELTRDDDEGLTLQQRGEFSAAHEAGLVISVHHNAAADNAAHGLLCFCRDDSEVGYEVARKIMSCAPEPLRRTNATPIVCSDRDWTKRAYNVLRVHEAPAVLVECGFLTSEVDRLALHSDATQAGLVVAVMAGVARYLQLQEVSECVKD